MTMINTKKRKRARTVRRVTTGVAAGAAVGLAVAGVAVAARRTERVLPKLPAPGATAQVQLVSKGIELAVAGRKIRTGPLQGRATFEIEAHPDDPGAVRTRITEFRLSSTGARDAVVTVEQRAGARTDATVLRRVSPRSARFQHTLALECEVNIANPRALGLPEATDDPLSLRANVPVELVGKPADFPDFDAVYKLHEPIALSGPNGAGEASMLRFSFQIQGF
ncbi:hypothetical protein AB0K52_21090 [Glycomyces sp. NPDC049804]|uniref:hypothetical protein n=1 Tax=Glycomyces sp. NPDC049804 TaxID=3154363 RepID=UPI00344816AF